MKRSLSVTVFALTTLAVLALWPASPRGIQRKREEKDRRGNKSWLRYKAPGSASGGSKTAKSCPTQIG